VIWPKLLHGFSATAAVVAYLLTGDGTARRRHSALIFLSQGDFATVIETYYHLDDAGQERWHILPSNSTSLTVTGTVVSVQVTVILVCVFHDLSMKTEPCCALRVFSNLTTRFQAVTNEMNRHSLPHLATTFADNEN
jgi:hypothetical protein